MEEYGSEQMSGWAGRLVSEGTEGKRTDLFYEVWTNSFQLLQWEDSINLHPKMIESHLCFPSKMWPRNIIWCIQSWTMQHIGQNPHERWKTDMKVPDKFSLSTILHILHPLKKYVQILAVLSSRVEIKRVCF